MTRVQKNKKVYKKRFIKEYLYSIVALIIGLGYAIYKLIKWFNTMSGKAFMLLPRIARVVIIYLLIASAFYGNTHTKTIEKIKEKVVEKTIEVKVEEQVNAEPVELVQETCQLSQIECKIYNKSIEYGLSREQAFIVVSISRHETGKWTSKAFLEKNNMGGIMCSTGLRVYATQDEGIDAFVSLLKNRYFDRGLDTIEKIQPVYCPIGASNDPKGVNQYWLPNVTKYYNEYLGN